MAKSGSPPARLLLIANPDNRRASGFAEALARGGWPSPLVYSHQRLIADPSQLLALPDEPMWVRIDSCGEDADVERALLELGAEALPEHARCERISAAELARAPRSFGQITAPRQHHEGFLRYLDALARVFAERPQWRLLNDIADIRSLFDKRETSRRYADSGIPVPDTLTSPEGIHTPEQLREAMVARRWPAVFVKLSCSSSASCLAIYRHLPWRPTSDRDHVLTTVATTPEGRFNSLRLQQLRTPAQVDPLLQWLLDEGVQIERAIPKARLEHDSFDLRVLVIAGEPAFIVVRRSRHPITNLHLGGARGELADVRARVPAHAWAAAMRSCERVFAAHRSLHVGVDLMFETNFEDHRIIEANAFGDLLPRLERDGKDVYGWQLTALERGAWPAPTLV